MPPVAASTATLHFTAVAGKTYTLLYRDNLVTGAWLNLANISAQSTTGPVAVNDPTFGSAPSRFYRLVTPALP